MGSHVDYLRGHQRAKKVVSHSLGLVDFAIGLANSVLNLPDWQVKYFEEFSLQKNCEINSTHQKILGLVEMTFGLVNVSFSLPEWQAVKMTFFAPWVTQTTRWFFLLYLLNIYISSVRPGSLHCWVTDPRPISYLWHCLETWHKITY